MGHAIRQMDQERNFREEPTVQALQRAVPTESIDAPLRETNCPVCRIRNVSSGRSAAADHSPPCCSMRRCSLFERYCA
jgi:hypothetical protein